MAGYQKTKKYTAEQNSEWRFDILDTLTDNGEGMTIEQMQFACIRLAGITPQKMARLLSELIEMGLVKKAKNKAGRMVYKSTSAMREQGYDV